METTRTLVDALAEGFTPVGVSSWDEIAVPSEQERVQAERISYMLERILRSEPSLLCSIGWTRIIIPDNPPNKLGRGASLYVAPI